jgi:signal transduction histidine kinase
MRSIGYILRRQVGRAGDHSGPAGPAAATLESVGVRTATAIRCVAVAYVIVVAGLWHSFYTASAWRLAGPAVAVGWSAVLVSWLAARRRPAARLIVADSAVLIALALSGSVWIPHQMRGDTASWLYILVAAQSVVPLWCAPLALAAPLVLASCAAYWTGVVFLSPALAASSAPGAATALVLVVAAVAWAGYQMLDRRAVRADTALAEADAAEHDQYIALCRNAERREHERLLHDTVLNTLTALARLSTGPGGHRSESDRSEVIGRCGHDVALMEYALGGAEGEDQHTADSDPDLRLLVAIDAIALGMRTRGLDVHVQDDRAGGAGPPAQIPVPVVVAVARAVREALTNVARHAGTGEAWVDVCGGEAGPDSGAGPAGGAALIVTVRDRGVGFDPGGVGADRLGIRRSIVERMADCGGTAAVRSVPGDGTTVTLRVPAHASSGTRAWAWTLA